MVLRMATHIHAPKEVVMQTFTLFIMHKGVCARNGNILTQGMAWGEDFILDNLINCINFPAFTVTFVQVSSLTKVR